MRRRWISMAMAALAIGLGGCGDVGSGVANPPSDPSRLAAAAVGALFTSDTAANLAAKADIVFDTGQCANDPGCTCTGFAQGNRPEGREVAMSAYADAGTYGSSTQSITAAAADFCTLSDGTANTGLGPDGRGRLAGFVLIQDVVMNCTPSAGDATAVLMKTGSTGIWRNTDATATEPAYQPQIFGRFTFEAGGAQTILDCTIYMGSGDGIIAASCTDDAGDAVTVEDAASCLVQVANE